MITPKELKLVLNLLNIPKRHHEGTHATYYKMEPNLFYELNKIWDIPYQRRTMVIHRAHLSKITYHHISAIDTIQIVIDD